MRFLRVGGLASALALVVFAQTTSLALATPVATTEQERQILGRTYLEPLQSTNYIQHGPATGVPEEFRLGMELLAKIYPRYLTFTTVGKELNTPYAFSPGPDGLPPWNPKDAHDGYPFYVSIVTDKTVPDTDKEYVLITNAHSAEPCGREASIRYVEDLLIWATTQPNKVLDDNKGLTGATHSMTVSELLKRLKLYVVSTSPDGWRSGDGAAVNGVSGYSNYNDAGINTNRVAYQEGWVYPNSAVLYGNGYTVLTQPEGAAITTYLRREMLRHGKSFAAAADIHGPVPVGAILLHDQGNDPVKLLRVEDLAERIKQNMNDTLGRYITPQGASVYNQAMLEAEQVKNRLVYTYTGATGQSVNKVAFLPLEWATYGGIWDQLSYTVTGSWGGWDNSNAGLGADAISYEVDCLSYGTWQPALMQLFVDNMRSIIQATIVNAAARTQGQQHFTRDLKNPVGFFEPGVRLSSSDNPSPPPAGFPGNPLVAQVEQRPYNVENTDYFRDLRKLVSSPVAEIGEADLSTKLGEVGTFVMADALTDQAAALRQFANAGGNLVLTDKSLRMLPELVPGIKNDDVKQWKGYVGYADLDRTNPITNGLPRLTRQFYDPVGIGYPLLMERDQYWGSGDSGTVNSAPIWTVARTAWEAAGGTTIGTADPPPTPKSTIEGQATDKTNVGVIKAGKGRIVIVGAYLPQPTDKFTHWFGLDPYTVSVGAQELFLRFLTWSGGSGVMPAEAAGGATAPLPVTTRAGAQPVEVLALGLLILGLARILRRTRARG